MNSSIALPPNVTVTEATYRDRELLDNLLQLYLYDSSEFDGRAPDASGRFEYRYFDHYFDEGFRAKEARTAFLVRVGGVPAGFFLKNRHSHRNDPEVEHSIAEFFIMRQFRRKGLGTAVAHHVFDLFPGVWEVAVLRSNLPGLAFWRLTIGAFTGGRFAEHDSRPPAWDGYIQVFRA